VGLDLQQRAFTEESALIELAGLSEAHAEEVAFLERYLVPGPVTGPLAPQELHRAFTELGARMAREHPGIAHRCCSLGRSWDVLHYLLSAGRRAGESLADDHGTWAIRGSDPLGELARGCQGIPIRYVTREKVIEVSHFLEDLRPEELRGLWDPERMEQEGVYKFWAATNAPFEPYWHTLDRLRAFYRVVEENRESVLIVLD
jgi:hypothetical protein